MMTLKGRFRNRVWRFGEFSPQPSVVASGQPPTASKRDLRRAIHMIKEVTEDLEDEYQFNTAVSELMKLSNTLADANAKTRRFMQKGLRR